MSQTKIELSKSKCHNIVVTLCIQAFNALQNENIHSISTESKDLKDSEYFDKDAVELRFLLFGFVFS